MMARGTGPAVVTADVLVIGTGVAGLTAALFRRESRGAHFRRDFPHPHEDWRRRVFFSMDQAGRLRPVEEHVEAAAAGGAP